MNKIEKIIKEDGYEYVVHQLLNYLVKNDRVTEAYKLMSDMIEKQHNKIKHEFRVFREYSNYTGQAMVEYDKDINTVKFLNIVRFYGLYDIHYRLEDKITEYLNHNNLTPKSFPEDVCKYIKEALAIKWEFYLKGW